MRRKHGSRSVCRSHPVASTAPLTAGDTPGSCALAAALHRDLEPQGGPRTPRSHPAVSAWGGVSSPSSCDICMLHAWDRTPMDTDTFWNFPRRCQPVTNPAAAHGHESRKQATGTSETCFAKSPLLPSPEGSGPWALRGRPGPAWGPGWELCKARLRPVPTPHRPSAPSRDARTGCEPANVRKTPRPARAPPPHRFPPEASASPPKPVSLSAGLSRRPASPPNSEQRGALHSPAFQPPRCLRKRPTFSPKLSP